MRNLTDKEQKENKIYFDKVARHYEKIGNCKTTQEFKHEILQLQMISENQPKELSNLWSALLIEIQNGSN